MSKTRLNAARILAFLYENKGASYTQRDLRKNVALISVGPTPLSDAVAVLLKQCIISKSATPGFEHTYSI